VQSLDDAVGLGAAGLGAGVVDVFERQVQLVLMVGVVAAVLGA
jgi:hypothetical protein